MIKDIQELVRLRKERATIKPLPVGAEQEEDSCVVFFVIKPGTSEALVEDRIVKFQQMNDDVFEGGRFYHLGSRSNGRALLNAMEKAMGLAKDNKVDLEVVADGSN